MNDTKYPVGKPFQEQGQWLFIDKCKRTTADGEQLYSLMAVKGLRNLCTCGRMEVIERKIRERVGKEG